MSFLLQLSCAVRQSMSETKNAEFLLPLVSEMLHFTTNFVSSGTSELRLHTAAIAATLQTGVMELSRQMPNQIFHRSSTVVACNQNLLADFGWLA